jgi:hypothetical protein
VSPFDNFWRPEEYGAFGIGYGSRVYGASVSGERCNKMDKDRQEEVDGSRFLLEEWLLTTMTLFPVLKRRSMSDWGRHQSSTSLP